ncbi:hypothetical protein ACFY2R_18925 [Micromonospora olivasterospora]|uniref:Uncharacterized protein n=1 Tax=Micromonospora olivasterospora TaxID=1880 RepID=A0A562IJ39_MICOL|nr:hypothetical protein [Micromonospora olivasterospora]TWH70836.1 hypothetical protein JD77_05861 [Micromonospora olivasterospora]
MFVQLMLQLSCLARFMTTARDAPPTPPTLQAMICGIGLPSSIEDTSAAVSLGRIGARAILSWVAQAPPIGIRHLYQPSR